MSTCVTSDVWDFFAKTDGGKCKCNLCGREYKSGGGTTNLRNHLDHKHPKRKRRAFVSPSPSSSAEHIDDHIDDSDLFSSSLKPVEASSSTSGSGPSSNAVKNQLTQSSEGFIQPTITTIFTPKKQFEKEEGGSLYYKCSECLVVFESVERARQHSLLCQPESGKDAESGSREEVEDFKKKKWRGCEVHSLLQAVNRHLDQFRDGLIPHKTVWEIVADEIGMSGQSFVCDLKFRNMKKTYRKILKANRTKDGKPRIRWKFFSLMQEIMKTWEPRSVNKKSSLASNGGASQPNGSGSQSPETYEFDLGELLIVRGSSSEPIDDNYTPDGKDEYETRERVKKRSEPAWVREYLTLQRQSLELRRKALQLRIRHHADKMNVFRQLSQALLADTNNMKHKS